MGRQDLVTADFRYSTVLGFRDGVAAEMTRAERASPPRPWELAQRGVLVLAEHWRVAKYLQLQCKRRRVRCPSVQKETSPETRVY
jgi:hypothetical protein